jgi:voltage-gated potassium channel Kch
MLREGRFTMVYYLIICRSLTYAQRTAQALERAGITAHILRSPRTVASEGCSHAVKISERNLSDALQVLKRVGLSPKQVFIMASDGSYKEVRLL